MEPKRIISVTGLGYVGLPLALEFAKKFKVIGFDINKDRIAQMKLGIDPSNELSNNAFKDVNIKFTSDVEEAKVANFHIIGVPTDIDKNKVPNLNPLISASKNIKKRRHGSL
jgi:UDP-N-acetyl-D-galactosamine dehydrogenase